MKLKKLASGLLIGSLLVGVLAGCGAKQEDSTPQAEKNDKVITVGASVAPHAEILKAIEPELKKEGFELKIVEFTDYVIPNKALVDGSIDANFFQHKPFLDDFNAENKSDLTPLVAVHYEPMAIFPGKTAAIADLKEGAKIAVPNDASNEARALLLLEANGIIKLKEGAGIKATKRDIAENPKNVDVVELEAAQIPRSLQDVDLAVINGNYALSADVPFESKLSAEDKTSLAAKTYANIIAVRKADVSSAKAKALYNALSGKACKEFIEKTYKGTVVAADDPKVN